MQHHREEKARQIQERDLLQRKKRQEQGGID